MNNEQLCGAKRKLAPNPTNWQFSAIDPDETPIVTISSFVGVTKNKRTKPLPPKKSLKNKFPAVYNQIYGNCTSNAVLACDAYYYHEPPSTWVPSTVFTYYNQRKMDKALNDPDDGSSVETALNAVRKYGACNSTVWPNNTSYKLKPTEAAYANGLKGHEVTKYYAVKSLTQIKKALNLGYPVPIAMSWLWMSFSSVDKSTFFVNTPTDKEIKKCDTGHAVVIVGYDDTKQAVEIRNSWGPNWGNNGYAYIPYDVLKKCIWWDDAYAVVK